MTVIDRFGNVPDDLAFKAPCTVASTAAVALSGLQNVDGISVTENMRVLVKDQVDATENGIYQASTGPWGRPNDANGNESFVQGTQVYIARGLTNSRRAFSVTCTDDPIIVGTSLLGFTASSVFARDVATEDRTYYVDPAIGSDANDGRTNTAGGAWATLQHAYDWLCQNLDFAGHNIKIKCAPGTFGPGGATWTSAILAATQTWTGGGSLTIEGDPLNQTVIIDPNTAGGFGFRFDTPSAGQIIIDGFKVQNLASATFSAGLFNNSAGSYVSYRNMDWGDWENGVHIWNAQPCSTFSINATNKISGTKFLYHSFSEVEASHDVEGGSITLTNDPTYFAFIYAARSAEHLLLGTPIIGTGHGHRYVAEHGGAISNMDAASNELDETTLPGDSAGILRGTGSYNNKTLIGNQLLASGSVANAATLDLNFAAYNAGYRGFRIVLTGLQPVTANVGLFLRTSADGVTYHSTGGDYESINYVVLNGFNGPFNDETADHAIIIISNIDNLAAAGESSVVDMTIWNPSNAALKTKMSYTALADIGELAVYTGGIMEQAPALTVAARFYFSAGNIAACNYAIYGLL